MKLIQNYMQSKLSLLIEASRLETFRNKWIFEDHEICSASNLARAGFYYTGTKTDLDSVTCFLCDKSLEGWEEDDDPWKEHQKHNNNCYFVAIRKPESELILNEYLNMWNTLRLGAMEKARLNIKEERVVVLKDYAALKKMLA